MKNLLFIACLISACGNDNNDKPQTRKTTSAVTVIENPIIGDPKRVGIIEIAANDFPGLMIWDQAKVACESLGKDWRLPNQSELTSMYRNKDTIGGFTEDFYWNSVEGDSSTAGIQDFSNGKQGQFGKINSCRARAVRNL